MRDDVVAHLMPPPASIEAEQAVLGGLLLHNAALDVIDDKLAASDFYAAPHRTIYAILRDLIVRGKPADAVTLIGALEHAGELEAVGGRDYLRDLLLNVPTAANIAHYAATVRERSVRRQLLALAHDFIDMASARDGRSVEELLDDVQRKASSLTEATLHDEPVTLRELMPRVVEDIEARASKGDELPGMPTGLSDLDHRLLGLLPTDLIVIAGETSSGKTTLAMGIALHAALKLKKSVLVFSMEMGDRQLAERALAHAGGVHKRALRTGKLDPDDWERVSRGLSKINEGGHLAIDQAPVSTVASVRAQAKRMKRKRGLDLVVVDYIQMMRGPGETENDRLTDISRGMKLLAKELRCPVIILSQLSRKFMSRPDKRPQRSDLRGSGSLEQDADVILFVYREALHSPDDENVKDVAELIIAKAREEELGTVQVTFRGQFNQFVDREQRYIPPERKRSPERKGFD